MDNERIPSLETDRLLLRPPEEGDLPAWAQEFFADTQVARYISKRPLTPMQRAERALQVARATWAARSIGGWVIAHKANPMFLGAINIEPLDDTHELEIGYGLISRAWGKGYTTEAVRAAVRYAFEGAGVPRLTARVVDANTASSRVLDKLGFSLEREEPLEEGRLLYYTLVKEKFAPGDSFYLLRS
ncbi:MAG: GNAT family N-acetyltransferase [Chloroflexi bacterium]|nr:GNAT family N-acetyltransferase [Chloroflexota bacterium]